MRSADQLGRLRWLLTGLFTALNAAGLLLFAWLVLTKDHQQGQQDLDAELLRVTSTVQRLLKYDGGQLTTAMVAMDELNSQCPQFAVLPTGGELFDPHWSRGSCVEVGRAVQAGLALRAVQDHAPLTVHVRAVDGRLVRAHVEPFLLQRDGQYVGAVVTWMDAQPEEDRHDQRVLLVALGCLVLIGVLGVAGHALSGRAMRPALAALEQQEVLLSDIAHDLRKPVTALRALAETALRNPGQRAELLPRTARLSARMGGIIDGLLLRARFAAGVQDLAVQPVWLDQLVAGVIEDTPAEGAHVTLTAAPTRVDADPVLIQRAVANLLGNALQHGRQPDADAVIHVTVAGGRVTVADNGPGIDAARAEMAFERFSGSGVSSGLGLSIVRWIAQAHGGVLRVYNGDVGGAIFELVLPGSGD